MASEVARIRQQIEDEIYAMRLAMEGTAITGRHDIIAAKNRNLTTYRKALTDLVGEEQAAPLFFSIYYETVERDGPCSNPEANQ